MKKYIAMLLSLAMILGVMVIPAGAAKGSASDPAPGMITVVSNGHGQYSAISLNSNGTNTYSSSVKDTLTAYATKDSDLFYVSGDTYLAEVVEDTYLMVQRIPLNTESAEANAAILEKYQLDSDTQDDIAAAIEGQKAIGNEDFEIDLFAPNVAKSVTYPESNYYTYNGNKMLDKFIKYSNMSVSTGEITGTSVRSTMSAFKNLILSAGGITIPAVGLFGLADSALAFYQNAKGTVSKGTASDKTYTNISYDKLVKKTSFGLGSSYLLGCTATKVWLNTNATYQYYQAVGQHHYGEVYLNQTRYTPSYNNAAYVALHNTVTPHDDGSMKAVIRGVTCYF